MISRNQCTIMIISFQIIDNSTVCSTACRGCQQRKHESSELLSVSQGDSNPEIASMSKRFYDLTASIILDTWIYQVVSLTYHSRVTNICVRKQGYHWF